MALVSSVADRGLKLARGTASSVADQGLKLARGTGKAAWSAGATCLSVADKGRREAPEVACKLARSTGKAAWIAGSTFLVLVLPLIFAMDREARLVELDNEYGEQAYLLGTR